MLRWVKNIYARGYNIYIHIQAKRARGWHLYFSRRLKLQLLLKLDNLIDFLIWKKGAFEIEVIEAIDRFKPAGPFLFIDAGSQLGQFSLYVKKHYPEAAVLSFEPYYPAFQQQQTNMLLNHLNYSLQPLALSDTNSEENLYIPSSRQKGIYGKSNPGMSSLHQHQGTLPKNERISVVRLDNFSAVWDDYENILLKIDVEGAESKVLRGAEDLLKAHKRVYLIIELLCKSKPLLAEEAHALLTTWGYQSCDRSWEPLLVPRAADGNYFYCR